MIIDSITLHNFRAYGGPHPHHIELSPRTVDGVTRPIVLFGGLNGAGKTTLLMAVKLALYGRHSLGMGTSKTDYAKFIRGCIHATPASLVKSNSTAVELAFIYGKFGQRVHYRVRRSWHDDGRNVNETLRMWKDDEQLESMSSEACQGFLNELIPVGVSELFFFDGERIAELAEDDTGNALGDAIHRLLGLDLVERLRNDLRIYMLRSESKMVGKDAASEIEELRCRYEEVKSDLAQGQEALDVSKREIADLVAKREALELQMTELGGDWGTSREAQRRMARELAESLKQDERELRTELAGEYPLSLATDILKTAINKASDDLSKMSSVATNGHLREFVTKIKKELNKEKQATVDRILSESLLPESEVEPLVDLTYQSLSRMEHTVHQGIPKAHQRVKQIMERIAAAKEELDTITLRIERAPDEATLADNFSALSSLNEQIVAATAEHAVQERELKSNYTVAIELARKLRSKCQEIAAQQELSRPLEHADGTRRILKELRRINTERKVNELEREFTVAFQQLARKDDIIAGVEIEPRRFTVKLINSLGGEIHKSQLSAGEKQIYAIAMLQALARTSGRKLPVIIDTPLGRLDSQHRTNLVEHYFPYASHQLIMLSTDTEIDEPFYESLEPHISHANEIIYDEREHMASIREGYFWQQTLKEAV